MFQVPLSGICRHYRICDIIYVVIQFIGETTMMKTQKSLLKKAGVALATVAFACALTLGSTTAAFAEDPSKVGTSEFPFDGPKENTFAQEMDLHQIYLVGEKFNPMDYKAIDPVSMNRSPALYPQKEKASPEPVCYGGNLVQTNDTRLDGHPKAVYLKASSMPATTGRIGSRDYAEDNYIEYTYEDAAIFPDGSSGDVTIKYTLLHIDAYQDVEGDGVEYGEPITITMFGTRLHANCRLLLEKKNIKNIKFI